MTEIPLSVNPDRLRAVANRVERSANALNTFRMPEFHDVEMPGSGLAALPPLVGGMFDALMAEMTTWVRLARRSADLFDGYERESTARLSES